MLAGLQYAGYGANALDMSPRYAGALYGVSNTMATIPGIVSPTLTGIILGEHAAAAQWRVVFYITTCIYVAGATIWLLGATGERVPALNGECKEVAQRPVQA